MQEEKEDNKTLFSAGNQALQHKRPQLSLEVRGVCGGRGRVRGRFACKSVIVTVLNCEKAAPQGS